ncbi:MAG: hypothetical protein H7098_05330 [Oligoflexus sp.]|nr:hypothetical protein [Pseudopedobacter sp.]
MKTFKTLFKTALMITPILLTVACNKNAGKYENLKSGEKVTITKDPTTGYAIDSITKEPVDFYVNLETKDTIYGKTGIVVNNALIKTPEGSYMVDNAKIKSDGDEFKSNAENVKIKVDGDETKIKTDNKKIKIKDGEKKVKYKD